MPVSSGMAYSVVASTTQNCSLVLSLSIPGHSLGLRVNGLYSSQAHGLGLAFETRFGLGLDKLASVTHCLQRISLGLVQQNAHCIQFTVTVFIQHLSMTL